MLVDSGAYIDGLRVGSPTLAELPTWLAQDQALIWLGLKGPQAEEFEQLRQILSLPPEARGLALATHEHPSFSSLGSLSVLVLRTAQYQRSLDQVFVGDITVLFTQRFVVTLRFGTASPITRVRAGLEARPDLLALGSSAIVHAIIDQVVADYIPVLHGLEREALDVERDVFSDTFRRSSRRIFLLKRQILDLYAIVDELADPLNRLIRTRDAWMSPASRERLQDVDDQLDRLAARARSLSELLTSALDAQLAQISVQQNEDMRRISAWVAILAVPTMVAGIYGMNFVYMPELRLRYGYPLAMGAMLLACTLLYRWFKRNRWL